MASVLTCEDIIMDELHNMNTDDQGNLIELHSVVVCKAIDVSNGMVVAGISENVTGSIDITEFNDNIINIGDYFEAEIIDFDDAGLPILAWGEIIPSYDIKLYSFVQAEVELIQEGTVFLRLNKYRVAKIPREQVDCETINVGDLIEAEVVEVNDCEGYSILGWGKLIQKKHLAPILKESGDAKETIFLSDNDTNMETSIEKTCDNDINHIIISGYMSGEYRLQSYENLKTTVDKNTNTCMRLKIQGKTVNVYVNTSKKIIYIHQQTLKTHSKLIETAKKITLQPDSKPISNDDSDVNAKSKEKSGCISNVSVGKYVSGVVFHVTDHVYYVTLGQGKNGKLNRYDIDVPDIAAGDTINALVAEVDARSKIFILKDGKLVEKKQRVVNSFNFESINCPDSYNVIYDKEDFFSVAHIVNELNQKGIKICYDFESLIENNQSSILGVKYIWFVTAHNYQGIDKEIKNFLKKLNRIPRCIYIVPIQTMDYDKLISALKGYCFHLINLFRVKSNQIIEKIYSELLKPIRNDMRISQQLKGLILYRNKKMVLMTFENGYWGIIESDNMGRSYKSYKEGQYVNTSVIRIDLMNTRVFLKDVDTKAK